MRLILKLSSSSRRDTSNVYFVVFIKTGSMLVSYLVSQVMHKDNMKNNMVANNSMLVRINVIPAMTDKSSFPSTGKIQIVHDVRKNLYNVGFPIKVYSK